MGMPERSRPWETRILSLTLFWRVLVEIWAVWFCWKIGLEMKNSKNRPAPSILTVEKSKWVCQKGLGHKKHIHFVLLRLGMFWGLSFDCKWLGCSVKKSGIQSTLQRTFNAKCKVVIITSVCNAFEDMFEAVWFWSSVVALLNLTKVWAHIPLAQHVREMHHHIS